MFPRSLAPINFPTTTITRCARGIPLPDLIEVTGIRPDGALIPSSSVGNNKTWLDRTKHVILEANRWQNAALDGMHDIYYGTALPLKGAEHFRARVDR